GVFHAEIQPDGSLTLRGELDLATVQDLQNKINEIMVPETPVVMDLAQLTFLDSSGIRCLVSTWKSSGHPVELRNASDSVHRILDFVLSSDEPPPWVFRTSL
ncbi:MAG TPA: STAS domain-containing protein, partial [Rubrobacter sp.]|nr:STAS domain-containing protein [Rubrobacter sp.]